MTTWQDFKQAYLVRFWSPVPAVIAAGVLAAAGLKRLGLADRIRHIFSADEMLPAAGQGALGIEMIAGRADLAGALAPLADQTTWLAVAAERAVSRAMGGSCSMPLAAYATLDGTRLHLRAAWGDPEGAPRLVTAQGAADVDGLDAAVALGERVAAELRAEIDQAFARL